MDVVKPRPLILHAHIFKNAGAAIDKLLQANYQDQFVEHHEPQLMIEQQQACLDQYVRDHPKLIAMSSHHCPLPLQKNAEINYRIIVFLRHPILRVSVVYHFERNQHVDNPSANAAKRYDFPDYVRWQLDNGYKTFCNYFINYCTSTIDAPLSKQQRLEQALAATKDFAVLGVVEHFVNSMVLLRSQLAADDISFNLSHINKAETGLSDEQIQDQLTIIKEQLGEDLFQTLLDENQEDLQFYDYAVQQLNEQIQSAPLLYHGNNPSTLSETQSLFDAIAEDGFFNHLQKIEQQMLCVAEGHTYSVLQAKLQNCGNARLLKLEELEGEIDVKPPSGLSRLGSWFKRTSPETLSVISCSAANEDGFYASVKAIADRHQVASYRLFNDVFINFTAVDKQLLESNVDLQFADINDVQSYAIVSIPRSGSTMLADILRQTNLCGAPDEHLRNPVVTLTANTDFFDFQTWLKKLMFNTRSPNNVVGTKLISHFAQSLGPQLSAEEVECLNQFPNKKLIYLIREDKAEQTISTYIAMRSSVFFKNTTDNKRERERFVQNMTYDFDELYNNYEKIIIAEKAAEKLIQQLKLPVLQVSYEEILANPQVEFERIMRFLQIDIEPGYTIPKPKTQLVSDDHCKPIRQRFAEDLRNKLNGQ